MRRPANPRHANHETRDRLSPHWPFIEADRFQYRRVRRCSRDTKDIVPNLDQRSATIELFAKKIRVDYGPPRVRLPIFDEDASA